MPIRFALFLYSSPSMTPAGVSTTVTVVGTGSRSSPFAMPAPLAMRGRLGQSASLRRESKERHGTRHETHANTSNHRFALTDLK